MELMDIGIVGLRRGSVARRFAHAGVRVLGFDAAGHSEVLAADRAVTAMPGVVALARALPVPRVVWLDVAPGVPTELMIEEVWPELAAGDLIVDAGDALHRDTRRRAAALASVGIHFVDCGIRGEAGATDCAVVTGGHPAAARIIAPFANILAPGPAAGWLHCGPAGAGHYVRMILGAMDVALSATRAEGLALLAGNREFGLDPAAIARLWRHGERSHVPAMAAGVADGAVNDAMEQGVPAPVLSLALMLALGDRRASAASGGNQEQAPT